MINLNEYFDLNYNEPILIEGDVYVAVLQVV